MMRALFAGVSGMRNHLVRLDVIGNNIANVNTVAFKSSRVTFEEAFAQLVQGASRPPGDLGGINPLQVGLGLEIGSIDQHLPHGNVESTGGITDLSFQVRQVRIKRINYMRRNRKSISTRSRSIACNRNNRR